MVLRRGDKSTAVALWQGFLVKRGFGIVPDAFFGPKTEHATLLFQRDVGVKDDGIVGPSTVEAAKARGFAGFPNESTATEPGSGRMTVSKRGREFIKGFEREILKVYDDGYGFLTAGVGHLLSDEEKRRFQKGTPITKAQSDAWFDEDLAEHAEPVDRLVKVPLTQGQYDALVSLVFNIGGGNFAKSSLLKRLNQGDYEGAKIRFDDWIKSDGRVSKGLVRRRNEEQVIFDS